MRNSGIIRLLTVVGVVALVALMAGEAHGQQGFFTVNATHDAVDAAPGDGVCADAGGACTLRAAVMETNALAGADEISLPAGTYVLAIPPLPEPDFSAAGDLDIRFANLTDALMITGDGASGSIIDGSALDDVIEIWSGSGQIQISGVTIRNGRPADGGPGGGIRNYSLGLVLTDVVVVGNQAPGAGGVFCFCSMTMVRTAIRNNISASTGGGLVSVFGSTVGITDSVFAGNRAADVGGAIYNVSADITITGSTISENTAGSGSGGIFNASEQSSQQGKLVILNTTVSGNVAGSTGGGIGNGGTVSSLPQDFILRGGIVSLTDATITGNVAEEGGGLFAEDSGSSTLRNSIVGSNSSGSDCSGSMTSLGHNLDSDGTCDLNGPGDFPNANPRLGPLADNGGPTQTHALLAGSAAIDAGDPASCPSTDQRGVSRPQDGNGDGNAVCDIGAYESTGQTGTVAIIKDSVPDSPNLTAFAATNLPCPPFPCQGITFNLDDDNATSVGKSTSFPAGAGTVQVQETTVGQGWTLTAIACSDGSRTDLSSRTAFIDVAFGEQVTCTFTNTLAADPTPANLPAGGGDAGSADGISVGAAAIVVVPLTAFVGAVLWRMRRRIADGA